MNPTLRDSVVAFVFEHDHVTFVELVRFAREKGLDASGNYGMGPAQYPGVLYWVGMSHEFVDAISELTSRDGPLDLEPCSILPYAIDGATLDLPLVRRAQAYKSDHWLPVLIRPRAKALRKGAVA